MRIMKFKAYGQKYADENINIERITNFHESCAIDHYYVIIVLDTGENIHVDEKIDDVRKKLTPNKPITVEYEVKR